MMTRRKTIYLALSVVVATAVVAVVLAGDDILSKGVNPLERKKSASDELPGIVELSDGRVLAGKIHTTPEKPFSVYVKAEKRWRRVPLPAAMSITAVVVEEKMELQWRWKGMGEPEKIYTGKSYPTRRLEWKFRLADDSCITGTVKGQPVWVVSNGKTHGPFILHERSKGKTGRQLKDLVYIKRIIVSKTLMEKVLAAQAAEKKPATKPAE